MVRALETVNHWPIQKKRRNQSQKKGPKIAACSLSDLRLSSVPPTQSVRRNRTRCDRARARQASRPQGYGASGGEDERGRSLPAGGGPAGHGGGTAAAGDQGGFCAGRAFGRSPGLSTRRGKGEKRAGQPRNGAPAPRHAPGGPQHVRGSALKPERALPSLPLTAGRHPSAGYLRPHSLTAHAAQAEVADSGPSRAALCHVTPLPCPP